MNDDDDFAYKGAVFLTALTYFTFCLARLIRSILELIFD
jgi:hypothetical protein